MGEEDTPGKTNLCDLRHTTVSNGLVGAAIVTRRLRARISGNDRLRLERSAGRPAPSDGYGLTAIPVLELLPENPGTTESTARQRPISQLPRRFNCVRTTLPRT